MALKQYVVFDIGGTFTKYAVCDSEFNILKKDKFAFEALKKDCHKELTKLVGEKIVELEKEFNTKFAGVGISTAGDIDPKTTLVIGACPNHHNYAGTV